MKKVLGTLILITTLEVFALTPQAFAIKPTWAKRAMAFPSQCDGSSDESHETDSPRTALAPPPSARECKPLRILSPNGQSSVEVAYRKVAIDADDSILRAYLRVSSPEKGTRETSLPAGFQDIELLWSPDSKAFFVNGGNGGGYWGFWVYVYLLDAQQLTPNNVTEEAQQDMVRLFPPCKASGLDKQTCAATEKNPEYNMTGIDWVGDSSAIVVMAEIPCAGSFGGIMCQIMGYELQVPTGKILKRMTARQFAATWQKSMAWKFEVPPPPEYCTMLSDRKRPACAGHNW